MLDKVDVDVLKEEYDLISAFKNGPRLWCLDWVEVMVGGERDFNGLKARWVMWLDVPKEMRKHESVAYKSIAGKRDTQLGINQGSPVFILDDPDGNSWVHEVGQPDRGSAVRPTRASRTSADASSRHRDGSSGPWCSNRTWSSLRTTAP